MYATINSRSYGSPLFSWSLDGAWVPDMTKEDELEYDGIRTLAQDLGRLASDRAWAKKQKMKPNSFVGDYAWLSNMYLCSVIIGDMVFPSAENAFQAMKCRTKREMEQFQFITPYEAKKLGNEVRLRSDWEKIKDKVMKKVIAAKFEDQELALQLLKTDGMFLCERNWWGDDYWGKTLTTIYHYKVDGEEVTKSEYNRAINSDAPHVTAHWKEKKLVGENRLGKILCDVRDEIKKSGMYNEFLETYIQKVSYDDWMRAREAADDEDGEYDAKTDKWMNAPEAVEEEGEEA